MKHYWDEAAFIPDVRDSAGVLRVAGRFLELRGDDLVGGLVVRPFEQYQPGEVRSWWVNGHCAVLSAHPDTPELEPPAGLDSSTRERFGSRSRGSPRCVTSGKTVIQIRRPEALRG
jgi:ATP-grasp domain, R2K clade family 3